MSTAGASMTAERAEKKPERKREIVQSKWYSDLIDKLKFVAQRRGQTIADAGDDVCGDAIVAAYLEELDLARREVEGQKAEGPKKKGR